MAKKVIVKIVTICMSPFLLIGEFMFQIIIGLIVSIKDTIQFIKED